MSLYNSPKIVPLLYRMLPLLSIFNFSFTFACPFSSLPVTWENQCIAVWHRASVQMHMKIPFSPTSQCFKKIHRSIMCYCKLNTTSPHIFLTSNNTEILMLYKGLRATGKGVCSNSFTNERIQKKIWIFLQLQHAAGGKPPFPACWRRGMISWLPLFYNPQGTLYRFNTLSNNITSSLVTWNDSIPMQCPRNKNKVRHNCFLIFSSNILEKWT